MKLANLECATKSRKAGGSPLFSFGRACSRHERRLLLGYRAVGAGHSGVAVYRYLRDGAHHRLDRPVERNDLGSGTEDRPSAPAVRRLDHARCATDGQASISVAPIGKKKRACGLAFFM